MDTKLLTPDPDARPRFRALADRLCAAVTTGEIPAGAKLPPVRDLAYDLGISPGAVARAYRLGVERGVLEATVGRGTFARSGLAGCPAPVPPMAVEALVSEGPAETLDLRNNQAIDVGQDAEIGLALQRLLERSGGAPPLTGYRRREDDFEPIEIMAGWLRTIGVPADPERLLITPGAQAGVVAAMATLARGGTGIALTPPLLHPGLRDAAAILGTRLEPVPADADGILPDALDAACARLRPDSVQLTATLHNPTLTIMPPERRAAIVEIVRRRNTSIIEDDVYGHLLEPPTESFAALAPERTWYVGSLSKCVAAGIRVGLVLTPPGRTMATLRAHQAFAHGTPWLIKQIAGELVRTGAAERIRRKVLVETASRAALADRLLGPYGAVTHPAASFVYVPLAEPWTSTDFVAAAAGAGVLLPPPTVYRVAKSTPDFVRIALGARTGRAGLEEGLHRLAKLLREGTCDCAMVT
ncbi:MAG: PLP-dependent aminotransferase family protein [Pseudomonadota bacterium]